MLLPDVQVTLLEPMARRVEFLDECRAALGLRNVIVRRGRAEEVRGRVLRGRGHRPGRRPAGPARRAGDASGAARRDGTGAEGPAGRRGGRRGRTGTARAWASVTLRCCGPGSARSRPPATVVRLIAGAEPTGSAGRQAGGARGRPPGPARWRGRESSPDAPGSTCSPVGRSRPVAAWLAGRSSAGGAVSAGRVPIAHGVRVGGARWLPGCAGCWAGACRLGRRLLTAAALGGAGRCRAGCRGGASRRGALVAGLRRPVDGAPVAEGARLPRWRGCSGRAVDGRCWLRGAAGQAAGVGPGRPGARGAEQADAWPGSPPG